MPKRFRSQPNLFRATKVINKLVESQGGKYIDSIQTCILSRNCVIVLLGIKDKRQPTRKAKRKLQRLEKKKRRAVHQNRKAASTEVVETESKVDR